MLEIKIVIPLERKERETEENTRGTCGTVIIVYFLIGLKFFDFGQFIKLYTNTHHCIWKTL